MPRQHHAYEWDVTFERRDTQDQCVVMQVAAFSGYHAQKVARSALRGRIQQGDQVRYWQMIGLRRY